jgi:hypothetical protein
VIGSDQALDVALALFPSLGISIDDGYLDPDDGDA